MLNRIFSILSSEWLIHQDTAISYFPVLISFINGQKFDFSARETKTPNIFASLDNGQISLVGKYEFMDDSIPDNSVALITMDGPMESEMYMDMVLKLQRIESNPRINSVILQVNSPGGMVTGLDVLGQKIKSMQKPVVAIITGMAASAAMWVISSASRRIATSSVDMIGSIGTMATFRDFSGLLEKIGIKSTDLYGTKASRKNEEYRAMKENADPALTIQRLDFINEVFHSTIAANLNISRDSEVFSGAVYFAEQARQLGLIDEIASIDQAVSKAYLLGLQNKFIHQSKSF